MKQLFFSLTFLIAIAFSMSVGIENTYAAENDNVQASFTEAQDADLTVIIELPVKVDNDYDYPLTFNIVYECDGYIVKPFNPPDYSHLKFSKNYLFDFYDSYRRFPITI